MNRIEIIRDGLANKTTINIILQGRLWQVEYLVIPAMSEEGNKLPPIFNYPGGMTHFLPCIEPFLFLDRRSIHISPLGYGNSSDIPGWFFRNEPYHGAKVALQVLKSLGEEDIIVYGHSNASSIVLQTAIWANEYGIKIREIYLVNPLGLRKIPVAWAALAFPVSGTLSRALSWRHESPFDFLKEYYRAPKHSFSFWKIWYELRKSSEGRLPDMFKKMQGLGLKIPVTIIQGDWDWASFHAPWSRSNWEILQENISPGLLGMQYLSGLHNVTLGKDSEYLARVMERSL
jgi:pimeloyl-ACP methyl ester carboxylesterase